MTSLQKAIVKSVLSGDTLIIRQPNSNAGQVLHLAGIDAPRLGTASREDEPFAFEAREFLRLGVVGKEITFTVAYTSAGGTEFGNAYLQPSNIDITTKVLSMGWAKLRDGGRKDADDSEDGRKLASMRAAEEAAKASGIGMWAVSRPPPRSVSYTMPADSMAFMAEFKGKPIDAIVEQVRDGTMLRCRLILSPTDHQFCNVAIAGARAPRIAREDGQGPPTEELGDEAKSFTEARLLNRQIKVTILSLPTSTAPTPFSSLSLSDNTSNQQLPSNYIGLALHPAGNIAEFLLSAGLAKVVDWHTSLLSSIPDAMPKLKAAENVARKSQLGIWKNHLPSLESNGNGASSSSNAISDNFNAIVVRVWNGEQISAVPILSNGEEGPVRKLQLSSIRQPRPNDPKFSFYSSEAKELLRKKLIGKRISVSLDYVKPKDGQYDEQQCVTVHLTQGQNNINPVCLLLEAGLATLIRHRQSDENRSAEYDKLLEAESKGVAAGLGMHSNKEIPAVRIGDASESHPRALQFLATFKRYGQLAARVDFIATGSRFKLFIPRENTKITFVLSGIRAPRTARNVNEKSEPFGPEGAAFALRFLQDQDVSLTFDTVDRSGGFIGRLLMSDGSDFAVKLLENGLATVHNNADGLPNANELLSAQTKAKKLRQGLWKDSLPLQAEAQPEEDELKALPSNLFDMVVSDIRSDPFGFSIQYVDESTPKFAAMMGKFEEFHKNSSAPANYKPSNGELVSAIFPEDGSWYRARILRSSQIKQEAELLYIDYGNRRQSISFTKIRPLPNQFKDHPPQAKDAVLSFINLLHKTDYDLESEELFRSLCQGRQIVGNIDAKINGVLHLRLIDPVDPSSLSSPEASINVTLVESGLALVSRRLPYTSLYPAMTKRLEQVLAEAKVNRRGAHEYGEHDED